MVRSKHIFFLTPECFSFRGAMRSLFKIIISLLLLLLTVSLTAQTSTTSSGDWSNDGNWDSGSPNSSDDATINHSMTMDTDITVDADVTFNATLTDDAGGSAYKLTIQGSSNFVTNADITTEGDLIAKNNSVITISGCGTLTVGSAEFQNNAVITVDSCATLVINGDLLMKNNLGMTVNGHVIINGDVTATNNTVIEGDGGISATGEIDVSGSATVFGETEPCATPPCGMGAPLITEVVSIVGGNWSNTATWDCTCVPDSTHNVTIAAGHSVVLDGDNAANNFIINGSFSSSGANSLNVAGNWDNQGTYTNGSETINFDGGIAQNILGAASQTFTNITVSEGSSVTNGTGTITMIGNLLIPAGSFDCANNFILRSDASGTANIGDLTNGTFTGNVIYERQVPAGATNWRFFSSALANQTVSGWNDDFVTAGFVGSDFPSFTFSSVQTYDETVSGSLDSGFVSVVSIAQNLTPGQGFWVWAGDNSSGTAAINLDLIGDINQGPISMPVTWTNTGVVANDGWNMVGNPYPSAIDWDAAGWTKTNIDDAVYIWDPNSGAYASYIAGVGNNGGSNVIASGQAFWVKASGASPVLDAVESVKSTSLADPFKSVNENHIIRMSISKSNTPYVDQTTFNFHDEASKSFEGYYDATKIESRYEEAPYISSESSDGKKLSINSFAIDGDVEIPIYVQVPAAGVYKFNVEDALGIESVACVQIRDEFTENIRTITESTEFIAPVPKTNEPVHRFTLLIGANNILSYTEPTCSQVNDGKIEVVTFGGNVWDYSCIDKDEKEVFSLHNTQEDNIKIDGLGSGVYTIVVNGNSVCSTRSSEIIIPEVAPTVAAFNSDLSGIVLIDNYEFNFLNESSNATDYFWDFGDGNTSALVEPVNNYERAGEYVVTMVASKNDICYDTIMKNILVLDIPFEQKDKFEAHVFPNPVEEGEDVLLHFNKYVESANIQILNSSGVLVYNHFDYIESTQVSLESEGLSAGVYVVTVATVDASVSFKLLIK